jgi:hypothetical protein
MLLMYRSCVQSYKKNITKRVNLQKNTIQTALFYTFCTIQTTLFYKKECAQK